MSGFVRTNPETPFPCAAKIRRTYSIEKRAARRLFAFNMHSQQEQSQRPEGATLLFARGVALAALGIFLFGTRAEVADPLPQEPQGEIIGTIEGQAIALKGPMSVQVVGNEVKTQLRSGVDIRVKLGRARINLAEGGTVAVCGPAHISMLKAGNALTIALDSGTIHAHVEGNLTLNVFTAQILAKTVAIGGGPQDVLAGFDTPGLMCVRANRGALRLEEQFGGQSVMVPQGGDVLLTNGQLQGMRGNSGLCACESFESAAGSPNPIGPEISLLANSADLKKDAAPRQPTAKAAVNPPAPDLGKGPAVEPTYQIFMPPLRYDSTAKIQDEPDPKLIVLVRRVRVRPTLIFQSRVEGDPLPAASLNAAKAKTEQPPSKTAPAASASVVDRVKTFLKSLWTPSS